MSYSDGRGSGLAGIITDWSQVSDAGLARAEAFLPPAQLQQVLLLGSMPRYTGPDTRATQDNLLQGQQPGGQLWTLVHDAIGVVTPRSGGISFTQAITQYPQLTGLFVAYELFGITSGAPSDIQAQYATPDALMTLATTRASQQGRFQTSVALPDDIDATVAQPYLQWVAHYLDLIEAETPTAIAGERDTLVYMVITYARQAALARGSTTLGVTGASGQNIVVPTELIHYQVELPDGTMYVVMDDVTLDPANRYVYQWLGPNWKPQAFTGPNSGFFETSAGTVCVGLVPGTGGWYTARVFGQVSPGSSCDATPASFTGPWDLITPDITAALTYQDGSPVQVVPPAQQVTNIPQVSPASGSGGGYTVAPPAVQPILLAPAPPQPGITYQPTPQIDPVTGVDLQPIAPVVEVHDVSNGQVVATTAPAPGVSPLLLIGGLAALVYFGSKRGR